MIKLCECGCGQEIIITKWQKYYGLHKFINGHSRKGMHHSKVAKEKIRRGNLGKHIGEKCGVYGIRRPGEKAGNWKGGITSLHKSIRNLSENKQWRSDVFQRDKFTCQICEQVGHILHSHHIKPFAQILEENNINSLIEAQLCNELWDIDNGITLCKDCHNNLRGNYEEEKENQETF